jgi:hypothetical protein
LCFLLVVVAVALAPLNWMPEPIFAKLYAGALGVAVLLFLPLLTVVRTRRALGLLVFCVLVALLLTAAILALSEEFDELGFW